MPLSGRPIVNLLRILAAGLVIAIAVWSVLEYRAWRKEQQPFNYGAPTPLADDQPMRTAVCAIRRELEQLPASIVDQHYYHEAWTEYKFAAGRFYNRPVHQITLTEPARKFVLSHSRAELIAALSPLLLDVERGGRAAAILAGLPARSKAALSNTSEMAKAVKDAQGDDPSAPIDWKSPGSGRIYEPHVPIQLYGLTNMAGRLERSVHRDPSGSFELRLKKLLEARSKLPMSVISHTGMPNTGARLTFDEMLAQYEPPVTDPRFRQFLSDFPRQDILIAVFPNLGNQRQGSGGALVDTLWANGAEDRFWPLVVGSPLIKGSPYKVFRLEVAAELIDMCNSEESS